MTGKDLNRFLIILERFATVAERWADVEYPKRDDSSEEAEFYKVGEQREAKSPEEYAALPDAGGRFQRGFETARTKT